MKNSLHHLRILTVAILGSFVTHLASAAPFEWTGASGVDDLWATAANWNPSGPPAPTDSPVFGVTDVVGDSVTINNMVGASATIAALSYTNSTAATWNVTEIPTGVTLTVAGTVVIGGGAANNLSTAAAMVGGRLPSLSRFLK